MEFVPVAEATVTNDTLASLEAINNFIELNSSSFEVESIYLEMNGFDINYDRWYFDYFAYDKYSNDPEDLEWLCYWQSKDWPETQIAGMKYAQQVFKWYHENQIWKTKVRMAI